MCSCCPVHFTHRPNETSYACYLAREANQTLRQSQTHHPSFAVARWVTFLPNPHWCSRASLRSKCKNRRFSLVRATMGKTWPAHSTCYFRWNECMVRAQANTGVALIFDHTAVLRTQTPDQQTDQEPDERANCAVLKSVQPGHKAASTAANILMRTSEPCCATTTHVRQRS